jgi:DNA mismatch repair protein MutS
MGGRLLKRWLALPLKDSNKIQKPSVVVSYLQEKSGSVAKIRIK